MASGQRQGLHTLRLGHKIPRCAASSGAGSLFPPLQSQAQNLPAAALGVCSLASAGVSSRRAVTQGHAALPNANMGQKSPAQPVPEAAAPGRCSHLNSSCWVPTAWHNGHPQGLAGGTSGGGAGEHVVRGQSVKAAGGEEPGLFCGAASISEGLGAGASQPRWLRCIQREQLSRAPWAPEPGPRRCQSHTGPCCASPVGLSPLLNRSLTLQSQDTQPLVPLARPYAC